MIEHNVRGYAKIFVDDYTYGYEHIDVLLGGAEMHIGKFCSIAVGVKAYLGYNHRTDWITTYPFGDRYADIFKHEGEIGFRCTRGNVIIGNDVCIGMDARIMSGVKIGDGAVIGAHTVIARDIPPYCVAVGNPSRVVKKRFSDEDIAFLLELKWWDRSIDQINKMIPFLTSNNIQGLRDLALTL